MRRLDRTARHCGPRLARTGRVGLCAADPGTVPVSEPFPLTTGEAYTCYVPCQPVLPSFPFFIFYNKELLLGA